MANEQMITAFGTTKSIADWHRDSRCRTSYKTLYARLAGLDWLPELAITTPPLRVQATHRYPPRLDPASELLARHLRMSDADAGF